MFHKTLSLVTGIDLSSNSLSQEIPMQLTKLSGLLFLNLSRNHLTGGIPKSIGNLKLLEFLDLSMNQLSGPIPPSIANLAFMGWLNLSNNNLSGRIPSGYQIQTLNDPSVYSGNVGLCGPPVSKDCSDDRGTETRVAINRKGHDLDDYLTLYLSVLLGFIFGFWIFWGSLLFIRSWRVCYFLFIDHVYDMFYRSKKG